MFYKYQLNQLLSIKLKNNFIIYYYLLTPKALVLAFFELLKTEKRLSSILWDSCRLGLEKFFEELLVEVEEKSNNLFREYIF